MAGSGLQVEPEGVGVGVPLVGAERVGSRDRGRKANGHRSCTAWSCPPAGSNQVWSIAQTSPELSICLLPQLTVCLRDKRGVTLDFK